MPIYAYIPLTEWEPLTLPFYASVLYYVPYYAIKPTCVLGSFNLDMYALDDPYVLVPYFVLVTCNAPGSPCFKDPFLKSLSFRGNRAKFRPFPLMGYRAKIFKPFNVLFIAKKTLRSCNR